MTHHLNNLNNPESVEESSTSSSISIHEAEESTEIYSAQALNTVTDKVTTLINSYPDYELPVSPVPFVENYVHYYIVGLNIQERLAQDSEQVYQEVTNLRRAIQRYWLAQGVTSKVTLSVLSDTTSDTVVLSCDSNSIYVNTEPQRGYISDDSSAD